MLAAAPDPFVTRVDDTWLVVSAFDAWRQLAPYVRPADLQRLPDLIATVLLEDDPTAALPAAERWRAAWEGKHRAHSATLRDGLATTTALLGAMGTDIDAGRGATGSDVAAVIVRDLVTAADDDASGARWAVLSELLPLLAEAAPDRFLDGVRTGLAGPQPVLRTIFRDSDADGYDPMFSTAPHTGLLSALETTAWSSDHLGQSIDLLARLAELDPGGHLSNWPAASLRSILNPGHPGTTAAVARRLEIVDGLRARHGAVAWPLMLALLPEEGGWLSLTDAPRYRDWKPATMRTTQPEWFEFIAGLVDRLIDDAGQDPHRWRELLQAATDLLPSLWQQIRETLAQRAGDLADEGREELWNALRALAAEHREHADTDWAFPADEVQAIEELADTLRPHDALAQHAWLFEEHLPDLGDASKTKDGQYDHEGYQAALAERRRAAALAVLDAHGWDGIRRAAATAAVPFFLGRAAAEADGGAHEAEALALLGDDGPRDSSKAELARGYLASRITTEGWSWVDQQLPTLDPVRQGRLLLITHDYPAAWERADDLGPETATEFWRGFSPFGLGHGFEPLAVAAERLLGAGRPASALQLLTTYAFHDPEAPAALATTAGDALDAFLTQDPPEAVVPRVGPHEFQQALRFLEHHRDIVGVDRVARLEWLCLPALGLHPDVPSLHDALAANPALFVELVSARYRRKGAEAEPVTPEQQQRAHNAYRLLSTWPRPPGTLPDGGCDAAALRAWIDTVLTLLDDAGRRAPGEEHIGMALASAPSDPDGGWPCEPVRDVLEDLQLERVEQAMRRQIYNSRGGTSRHPETGGDQERKLAHRYRDQAGRFNDRWPHTAAVLRSLAESLEHDARRYDHEAERRRRGIDL